MINCASEGPSVQVEVLEEDCRLYVINTIRIAETTQQNAPHQCIQPLITKFRGGPSALLACYLPIKNSFQIHKRNGTAFHMQDKMTLHKINSFLTFSNYFAFERSKERRGRRELNSMRRRNLGFHTSLSESITITPWVVSLPRLCTEARTQGKDTKHSRN